jgi:superfamily II DNA or RNA helicase
MSSTSIPQVGMLATIRNRRALITAVDPFAGGLEGQFHLVRLEYVDSDGSPDDSVIWEREADPALLEPTTLPPVATSDPMSGEEFAALNRATRWTALTPFIGFDWNQSQDGTPFRSPEQFPFPSPLTSPFFGAVQVEDFQLVPLLKALQMPRITLLLADDVGLGKTIEAGLILTEMLLRRRIRRVLILCPAALRKQWQQEMLTKFNLPFDVIDRMETHALQKRLGLDANPWRTFPRIITSYHYLRQADVLEQFRAACHQPQGSAQLPWDLLIVDEAHNLMPSNFGEDSDLSKMLRAIAPWFEHKLFLSATPHNGHTRCFSGLLEQLDPVRFTQTSEFTPAMQQRISEVLIRRLKREINTLDEQAGRIPRFCRRLTEPVPLYFSREEQQLSEAFRTFRQGVRQLITSSSKSEQLAGSFAIEVLNKRLLSCPYTFAISWLRFREGTASQEATPATTVQAARRATQADIDDDQETEGRLQYAAKTVGSWFQPFVPHLQGEIAAVDQALARLGLIGTDQGPLPKPKQDARWDRLLATLEKHLRLGNQWKGSERLVVFTEYKTTLDYLVQRLQDQYPDQPEIVRFLYGGMTDSEREEIKAAFNDPADPVRVLVATDAASEGLNLQETAHIVMHYDIPWNPARLDQRNGRLDRHGQAEDVLVLHFTSEDDADLKFLAHVVEKVNTIREELGSMGEVFDAAFQRRFIDQDPTDRVVQQLDEAVRYQQGRTRIPRSEDVQAGQQAAATLRQLEQELDLTPHHLRQTLEIALGMGSGLPRFAEEPNGSTQDLAKVRLILPIPQSWEGTVDQHLRLGSGPNKGSLPALVFDPRYFIEHRNGRPIFRGSKDTVLIHLGHPLYQQALASYARARFPGEQQASRWTVSVASLPADVEVLLVLTVEELAVNELREPFHRWIRTLRYPIQARRLGSRLPHIPAAEDSRDRVVTEGELVQRSQDLWDEIEPEVRSEVGNWSRELSQRIRQLLKTQQGAAVKEEKARFVHRIREVERAMQENTLQKLEKERQELLEEMQQLSLLQEERRSQEEKLRNLEDEVRRRRGHYQDLLDQLQREQDRVLQGILPQRYSLRGEVQVFPVTVEIRWNCKVL